MAFKCGYNTGILFDLESFFKQKLTKRPVVVCCFVGRPQFVEVILWVRYCVLQVFVSLCS
jgi:hypothetical protein